MSIYIKGMEMPKDNEILCINIMANGNVYYSLDLNVNTIANAVHVPPHGRLIDADEDTSNYVTIWDCDCSEFGKQTVMAVDDLNYLPTIIPADKED